MTIDVAQASSAKPALILGMGGTGVSVARYLCARGLPFAMSDSRTDLAAAPALRAEFPGVDLLLGDCAGLRWTEYGRVILSPGVPRSLPCVQAAIAAGLDVVGDIELFAHEARAPVVAVTGSNGKSTVVHLLWNMARQAGWDAELGGNFGTPALDLLRQPEAALYVLELSSFQLEFTRSLRPVAATILNLSEDHMDRYRDLDEYARAKARIFDGARVLVANRDDPHVMRLLPEGRAFVTFGLDAPASGHYGVREHAGGTWLAQGEQVLLPVAELRLLGRHNLANALAALALGDAVGLPRAAMLTTLREYAGLPHRTQWIRELDGVTWINDSKATNVGATLAALAGLDRPVVLLAGGQGKGQDVSPLRDAVAKGARAVVLFGEDAPKLRAALEGATALHEVPDLDAAIATARAIARRGDYVLLSPACASFDMFKGYAHRGETFMAKVTALPGGEV